MCSIDAWQCNLCFRRHLCSRFRDRSSERSADLYRRADGSIGLYSGFTEMGQGLMTIIIQFAVEVTGLPPSVFRPQINFD